MGLPRWSPYRWTYWPPSLQWPTLARPGA